MRKIMQYGFTSCLIIMTAVGLYVAKDWNSTTALFPRVVGFPMLAVTIAILAADIRNGLRRDEDGDAEFTIMTARMAKYFGWLIGFVVLVWAIGIKYTIPVYIFSYMKIEGKYGWLKCVLYAVSMTVFITILFEYVFRVAWPEGVVFRMID